MSLDVLKAIAEEAKQKQMERRAVKQAKPRPSAWLSVWDEEMRKHYPEMRVSYTGVDAANLKRAIKRGFPAEDMGPFFRWLIPNWQKLRATMFSSNPKFPKGPEYPSMKFIIVKISELHAKFTAEKPEVAATLPIGQRAYRPEVAKPEVAAAPLKKPVRLNPVQYDKPLPKLTLKPVDTNRAEELRKKLGLPKWKD